MTTRIGCDLLNSPKPRGSPMRVAAMLRPLLHRCRSVHSARLAALVAAVDALIRGGRLTLTDIGRSYAGRVAPKHSIKRADRLVGNSALWRDIDGILAALAARLIRGVRRPVILVDWTGVSDGSSKWALVASIPVAGRAIPILFEVHPRRRYCNPRVHDRFLHRLAKILPSTACPIIVADAGFHRSFWRTVDALGWAFVIRVRGARRWVGLGLDRDKLPCFLRRHATDVAHDLLPFALPWTDDFQQRLVISSRPNIARRRRTDRFNETREYYRRKAREPWLLATNLWRHSPSEIVAIYAARMCIEESFRDTKSHRYGWAFDYARSSSRQRLEVLMLVGA